MTGELHSNWSQLAGGVDHQYIKGPSPLTPSPVCQVWYGWGPHPPVLPAAVSVRGSPFPAWSLCSAALAPHCEGDGHGTESRRGQVSLYVDAAGRDWSVCHERDEIWANQRTNPNLVGEREGGDKIQEVDTLTVLIGHFYASSLSSFWSITACYILAYSKQSTTGSGRD